MDYDKIYELSKEFYIDNMGGLSQSDVERYRSGFVKGYQKALTIQKDKIKEVVKKVDCDYCGKVYPDTMCKIYPNPCKK